VTSPPPGWYPDPQAPALLRYWDGSQWTSYTQPAGMAPSDPRPAQPAPQPEVGGVTAAEEKVPLFGVRKVAEQLQRENHELKADNQRWRSELERMGAMEFVDLQSEIKRLAIDVERLRA